MDLQEHSIPLFAAPFVTRAPVEREHGESELGRFVLWQATGVVLDDTEFGAGTDPMRHRYWFPACTWSMGPAWWAQMREAVERIDEALRTGRSLRTRNFAERVVVSAVLRSDAPEEIIGSLNDAELVGHLGVVSPDVGDLEAALDLHNVVLDGLDLTQTKFLFPDDFREGPAAVADATCADLSCWFDPSSPE